MNKVLKIVLIVIVIDIVALGAYFGYKALSKGGSAEVEYEWITIDEYYYPQDFIEEFIKNDASEKGMLPVLIRNYERDAKKLRKFRGKNFAGPTETQIKLKYRDLEDWQLIDLKFTNEDGREVQRTILYVQERGEWKVGDSGNLTQ